MVDSDYLKRFVSSWAEDNKSHKRVVKMMLMVLLVKYHWETEDEIMFDASLYFFIVTCLFLKHAVRKESRRKEYNLHTYQK